VAFRLVDRDTVEFGLWFHDAVYDTGDTTNEWRSAELFSRLGGRVVRVSASCLRSHPGDCHTRTARGNDRCFVDIDLSASARRGMSHAQRRIGARGTSSQSDAKYHAGGLLPERPAAASIFTNRGFRDGTKRSRALT
jgi:hypothetical protein